MARILDSFPALPSQARHPWNEWLDGQVWRLEHGEDFQAKSRTFVQNARAQAKRRGGRVKTRFLVENGRESVVLQFRAQA
jgi:hypothetical protein